MMQHNSMVISLKNPPPPKMEEVPTSPPELPPPPPQKKRKSFLKKMVPVITVIVLGAGCGAGFFSFTRHLFSNSSQSASVAAAKGSVQNSVPIDDTEKIVESVGKLILLPVGEKPTIARVSNIDNLKTEAFFKNAALGDVVLMYLQSQKAILYRPSLNKIVEVAPIASSTSPGN